MSRGTHQTNHPPLIASGSRSHRTNLLEDSRLIRIWIFDPLKSVHLDPRTWE